MVGSKVPSPEVTITRTSTVAAALPLQEHWLHLSNLDLILAPLNVGVFFCYEKPPPDTNGCTFGGAVGELKKGLAKALVTYYGFAGEVVENPSGEVELLCNNRGVDFVEAYCGVELRELELHDADRSVEGRLVPSRKAGVFCVQVTELKCGGMVVGCNFDHRIADAYTTNMFLVSWAESTRSQLNIFTTSPCYRRSLLNPRRPTQHLPSLDALYVPMSSLPPPNKHTTRRSVSRLYHVSSTLISHLQSLSGNHTKLEAFTAFFWQAVAKASNTSNTSIGLVVDGRTHLNLDPAAMSTYFGNVISVPYIQKDTHHLSQMTLYEVAKAVHSMVKETTTEEHFRGVVDLVEKRKPEATAPKVYCMGEDEGVAVVVSSGRRFPVEKVDFGWGKAALGSYHFAWGGNAGYVMPMPSVKENGDWIVYVHLERELLGRVEKVVGAVFRPLSVEHLRLRDGDGGVEEC